MRDATVQVRQFALVDTIHLLEGLGSRMEIVWFAVCSLSLEIHYGFRLAGLFQQTTYNS